jgi:signal transduction histidine kinase/DNA-binding NarL/FixJ family response regulator
MKNLALKVLLIEDDIDYASLLHLRLTRIQANRSTIAKVQLIHICLFAEAEKLLQKEHYDLVLLDMSLPDAQGLDGLRQIRAWMPTLPVIVLTATDDHEMALMAIQLGAQDYLVKDELTTGLLRRSIHHAIARNTMLTNLEAKFASEVHLYNTELQSAIEHMADGIAVVDEAGMIQFGNAAFFRFLPCNGRACMNQPFGYAFPVDATTEVEMKDGHGIAHTVEMRVSSIIWQHQKANLILLRDISEQKRAALALEQYARELEVHNEDLDAFAHTVAHNLKAPLTHIILSADLLDLNKHSMNSDYSHYISTIVNYGRKMTEIIDDLLLLAEVRSREDLLLLPLKMPRLLHDVELRLKSVIHQYNARVTIVNAEAWPQVIGYAPWLEEVWTNYITNGLKYGGRPPRLEIGCITLPNEMARFWVRDNGDGITLEEQQALFQPFFRLQTPGVDGHGLGLSIVRRIIEKLGGAIHVESKIGEGSEFSFTLPTA